MRIALIIERIEGWRGGAETSTIQFAQRAAARGCEITLVTCTRGEPPPGTSLLTIRAPTALRGTRTAQFARRAAEAVRDGEFDLVHAITPVASADVYEPRGGSVPETIRRNVALRRTRIGRAAKRLTAGLNWKYRVLLRLERTLLANDPPPVVVALSHYVAAQYREHYGLDESRIRVIFNGVEPDRATPAQRAADDNDIRQKYDLARGESLVLCVAHNFRLKGVARLIEAASLLPPDVRARARFVIVGRDDPLRYVSLAHALGVGDRILFAGATQRIAAFYHAADMLVHPTYYDPCSRVVLEALASGVPVITTRCNGAAEIMTEGRDGFILESPDDVRGLADRIARLLDAGTRAAVAEAAKATGAHVGMDRHAEQVVALYRELIEARR